MQSKTECISIRNVLFTYRTKILVGCLLATAGIVVCDGFLLPGRSLGILYIVPILISGVFLARWQVLTCAVGAAVLRELFQPSPWQGDSLLRFSAGLVTFAGSGLVISEMMRRRRFEAEWTTKLSRESALRLRAQEDARFVIESSPAAILTVDANGSIELANEAARRLLCLEAGTAEGQNVRDYLPLLSDMLKSQRAASFVRSMIECRGRRSNGEMFFAHMWLSSYSTSAGLKLAAVVADVSEQVRDREEVGLRQLLMNSHIIAGAVSHEIRNLATAAGALYESIAQTGAVEGNEDFSTLGHLIDGMCKLSSSEIPADSEQLLTGVDLNALLKELSIILSSGDDDDIKFQWQIGEDLPRVRAHHSGLLQVFLNLTQNSRRALRGRLDPCITIAAYQAGDSVMVMVADNGPGIAQPERLFQPFQAGAASSGLGLYVSRAIIRTYGGEMRYARRSVESCFIVELPVMTTNEVAAIA